MLKLVVFITAVISFVESCPTMCYCSGNQMSCTKTNFTDDTLMGLQIPPDINHLTLSDNNINTISAELLLTLQHLKTLEITRNLIREIPEGAFRQFRNLEKLILNENKIEHLTERSFLGLTNLRYLGLEKNQISMLEPGVFSELKLIHTIRMQDNLLKIIPNDVFSTLPTLRYLFISRNEIESIDDKAFQHMQMDMMSIAKNKINIIPHTAFTGFHITSRVVLLDNPLDCSCEHSMSIMVNMKHLHKKVWGYCAVPYAAAGKNIFSAHEVLSCSMCDLKPCKNGGKCTGNKTQFKCNCAERYKGEYCEVNICSAVPTVPRVLNPDNVALRQRQINHTEYVVVKEQVTNKDDEKKLKILYAMCSFEFIVIICFVVYFMWKRYEEWKLQKQYEHDKSRAILFSIRNQTNAKLAKALCEENEEFPFDIKNMLLKGSVPV